MSDRPSWDEYFMSLAYLTSIKSPDPRTKHGSIIINKHRQVIGMGFNGYARNIKHDTMPKDNRKYLITIHSEENALINNTVSILEHGHTLYVTGEPCLQCLTKIISMQFERLVIGSIQSVKANVGNEDSTDLRQLLISQSNMIIDYHIIGESSKDIIKKLFA